MTKLLDVLVRHPFPNVADAGLRDTYALGYIDITLGRCADFSNDVRVQMSWAIFLSLAGLLIVFLLGSPPEMTAPDAGRIVALVQRVHFRRRARLAVERESDV